MKRKSFFTIIIIIIIVMSFFLFIKGDNSYLGNGVPYLVADGNKVYFTVINDEGKYEKKLGKNTEYFWLTSRVGEEETISVDNYNNIYLLKDDGIKSYSDIEDNIIYVTKVRETYLIICQDEKNAYLKMYSEEFKNKIAEESVIGTFDNYYIEDEKFYYSVHSFENNFTSIYCYDTETATNTEIYSYDSPEQVFPFVLDDTIYIIKNKKINFGANEDINKIFKLNNAGLEEEVMTIGEELVYIVNIAGTIYGIEGITNSSIVKYDLFNKKVEKLFDLSNENARAIYQLNNETYLITDLNIYIIENNKLIKKQEVAGHELVNEFIY